MAFALFSTYLPHQAARFVCFVPASLQEPVRLDTWLCSFLQARKLLLRDMMQLVPWCKPNRKGGAAYAGFVSPQIVVLFSFSILFFYAKEGERKEDQDRPMGYIASGLILFKPTGQAHIPLLQDFKECLKEGISTSWQVFSD